MIEIRNDFLLDEPGQVEPGPSGCAPARCTAAAL